ncbi:hypothetical protein D3C75_1036190 [compost metagenome]
MIRVGPVRHKADGVPFFDGIFLLVDPDGQLPLENSNGFLRTLLVRLRAQIPALIHLDTVHLKASLFVKRKIGVIPALPVILHQHLNLIGGNNRRIRHRFVDEGGKAGF